MPDRDRCELELGVFRRARRASDELPEHVVQTVRLAPPDCELRPGDSRAVRLAGSDRAWYLVPGRGAIGCYDDGGSGSVFELLTALEGRAISTSFRGTGRLLVSGLVPDAATQLQIVRRNGAAVAVDARDNLYAVEVAATTSAELPDAFRFVVGDHECRIDVPGADDEILTLRSAREAYGW